MLVVLTVIGSFVAAATPVAAAEPPRTIDEAKADLAGAEKKLDRLGEQRSRAAAAQVELASERRRLEAQVGLLDAEAEKFHEQLREARRDARLATVEAYVSGNRVEAAIDAEDSTDALWQETIIEDRADAGVEAAIRYKELRNRAEESVISLADDADRVAARLRQAATDEVRAVRSMASTRGRIAELKTEIDVLQIVARFGGNRGNPAPGSWAALRNCESHGNYAVNSGNGFYGAYQFDLQTWRSMGGSGLPSAAPPWEQDARAMALYQTRGSQPWPICGRFLG